MQLVSNERSELLKMSAVRWELAMIVDTCSYVGKNGLHMVHGKKVLGVCNELGSSITVSFRISRHPGITTYCRFKALVGKKTCQH